MLIQCMELLLMRVCREIRCERSLWLVDDGEQHLLLAKGVPSYIVLFLLSFHWSS